MRRAGHFRRNSLCLKGLRRTRIFKESPLDKPIKNGRIKQKENKMQKIIVEIEASEWTQEHLDNIHDWLQDELHMGNMGTGDDASVVSVKFAETK